MIDNWKKEKRIQFIFCKLAFIMSALISILLIFESFVPSVSNDEIFSLQLVGRGWSDIITLTARDVHPPLYYMWLKLFVGIGKALGRAIVPWAKLASLAPVLFLEIISFTYLRKQNELKAALFSLFIVLCPQFMTYVTQVRMYSLGMCFVTLAYISSRKLFEGKVKIMDGIPFVIFSLLAAFTQYFALICVIFIYFGLLVSIIKNRFGLWNWFAWVLISIISYLPWFLVAVRQILSVNNSGYWIEEITVRTIIEYIQFVMNPNVYIFHMGTLAGIVLLIILFAIAIMCIRDINIYLWVGLTLPVFLIICGVSVSILSQPVFSERYIFLSLGVFWVSVAELISIFSAKNIGAISRGVNLVLLGLLVIYLYFNVSWFMRTEREYTEGWNQMADLFSREMERGDVLMSNDGGALKVVSYLYPDNSAGYYWRQDMDPLFCELSSNLVDLRDTEAIMDFIPEGKSMWMLDKSDMSEFHFLSDLDEDQLSELIYDKKGTINLEGVMIDIIKVKRQS